MKTVPVSKENINGGLSSLRFFLNHLALSRVDSRLCNCSRVVGVTSSGLFSETQAKRLAVEDLQLFSN